MTEGVRRHIDRLQHATLNWPPGTVHVVRSYLRDFHGNTRRPVGGGEPYWALLPRWLHAAAGAAARRHLRPHFLRDISWAQYCLFLCVRIQDDVFDGHAKDLRLVFVANQLLLESERAFERHVPAAFWPIHRKLLETTTAAILEADEQQAAGRSTADGFRVHSRVSSIFKTGSAAVCLATGRPRLFRHAAALADELAIMSQVLDDLVDLAEDLDRARVNSVAALLIGETSLPRASNQALNAVGASLLFGDGSARLLAAVRASHARAVAANRPLGLSAAAAYLEQVSGNIERLAGMLHRARVEARFGRQLTAAALQTRGKPRRARKDGAPRI